VLCIVRIYKERHWGLYPIIKMYIYLHVVIFNMLLYKLISIVQGKSTSILYDDPISLLYENLIFVEVVAIQ
jgi:hypothetical protein